MEFNRTAMSSWPCFFLCLSVVVAILKLPRLEQLFKIFSVGVYLMWQRKNGLCQMLVFLISYWYRFWFWAFCQLALYLFSFSLLILFGSLWVSGGLFFASFFWVKGGNAKFLYQTWKEYTNLKSHARDRIKLKGEHSR